MKNFKNEFMGLSSGFLWALNGIVLSLLLNSKILVVFDIKILLLLPLVFAGINDLFAGLFILGYNKLFKNRKSILSVLKTKTGKLICFTGLIGGSVGQCLYVMGISLSGPTYSIIITSLCPIFGIIFSAILLKEKISLKNLISIVFCVLGIFILSYQKPTENYPNFYLGMLLSLFASVSWALEAVIVNFVSRKKIEEEIILNIRELISSVITLFIILPFFNLFQSFLITIKNFEILKYLIISGLLASFSYLLYYKAVKLNGVSKAMALNSTFSVWSVILSFLFLSTKMTINLIIGVFIVIISIYSLCSKNID